MNRELVASSEEEESWIWGGLTLNTIFWSVSVTIVILSSFFQREFFNSEFIIPFLVVGACNTFLYSITYLFKDKIKSSKLIWWLLYFVSSVLITLLMILITWNQSIFLILNLVNIIAAGLSLKSKGSYFVGFLSIIGYDFALLLSGQDRIISFLFHIVVNNTALVLIAILSGKLSNYLEALGFKLVSASRDFKKIKNLHELILSQIPTGVVTISQDGTIIHGNRRAEEILTPQLFHNKESWDKILKRLRHYKTIPSLFYDIPFETLDKERKIIRCHSSSIDFGPSEESDSIDEGEILVFEDVTAIKELEENLRNNEKLAAVGKLAAGIAHEIRNPLASISGSVQMLSVQAGNEEDKKLFNIVIRETDRLNLLISEFLDYAKPLPPPTERVGLISIISEVLEIVSYNKKLRNDIVQEKTWSSEVYIFGYKDKLKQAFLNIIINSYQAMDQTATPVLKVSVKQEEGIITLKIKDTGQGMKEETRSRIFEPFYTTKSKGTGLGLAVTHKILEAHGASIIVESEEGKGTEFVIKLKEADNLNLSA